MSDRGVQNTPLKIAKNAKKLNMNVLVSRGIEPTPALTEHSALDHLAIPPVCILVNSMDDGRRYHVQVFKIKETIL